LSLVRAVVAIVTVFLMAFVEQLEGEIEACEANLESTRSNGKDTQQELDALAKQLKAKEVGISKRACLRCCSWPFSTVPGRTL